ncbi:MAG: hypothetical protein EP308_14295 [Burkholderiales bacterium]|nr:MAG: hypothetical protein EP308_14295 [Burkholderiales bacterium]
MSRPFTFTLQPTIRSLLCVTLLASTSAMAEPLAGETPDAPTPTTAPTIAVKKGQNFVGMLARASLEQQGVTSPTADDVGVAESAVEAMRASGMGWGAIANSLGVNLGSLVSAENRSPQASLKRAGKMPGDDGLATAPSDGSVTTAGLGRKGSPGMGGAGSGQGAKGGASGGGSAGGSKGGASAGGAGGSKGGGASRGGGQGGNKGGGRGNGGGKK